ncbi:MAG: hypothetical protein IT385_10510 [Deltaproteobacteria bacterium]|nr:hypothetical protein [Deltaproteobacteria bacterium]
MTLLRAFVSGLVALAALVSLTAACDRAAPDEPVPIVWDREVCGHCRMAIGDPRFAAQLVTTSAEVVSFDDVGCMFRYLDERKPEVHRLWFHGEGERWFGQAAVGFRDGQTTPMGSGLMAVPAETPGALRLDDVRLRHHQEVVDDHHHR